MGNCQTSSALAELFLRDATPGKEKSLQISVKNRVKMTSEALLILHGLLLRYGYLPIPD